MHQGRPAGFPARRSRSRHQAQRPGWRKRCRCSAWSRWCSRGPGRPGKSGRVLVGCGWGGSGKGWHPTTVKRSPPRLALRSCACLRSSLPSSLLPHPPPTRQLAVAASKVQPALLQRTAGGWWVGCVNQQGLASHICLAGHPPPPQALRSAPANVSSLPTRPPHPHLPGTDGAAGRVGRRSFRTAGGAGVALQEISGLALATGATS